MIVDKYMHPMRDYRFNNIRCVYVAMRS